MLGQTLLTGTAPTQDVQAVIGGTGALCGARFAKLEVHFQNSFLCVLLVWSWVWRTFTRFEKQKWRSSCLFYAHKVSIRPQALWELAISPGQKQWAAGDRQQLPGPTALPVPVSLPLQPQSWPGVCGTPWQRAPASLVGHPQQGLVEALRQTWIPADHHSPHSTSNAPSWPLAQLT